MDAFPHVVDLRAIANLSQLRLPLLRKRKDRELQICRDDEPFDPTGRIMTPTHRADLPVFVSGSDRPWWFLPPGRP